MDGEVRHLVGLLLGTEEDWPRAFEHLMAGLGPVGDDAGRQHSFATERLTIEPFFLRARPRTGLVIDRLSYWYYHPREWLKKAALMDDVYLLNSPFTFQAMEKHAAYCAMIRLGLKIPETVLVPYKNPVDHDKYAFTSQRYNQAFDLDAVAEQIGYPLYMKPYDGGGWRGVSRIDTPADLHRAYDESGGMLMHLQASVQGFDAFARALSIGAETMVVRFDPDAPMHERYRVDYEFLEPAAGTEVVTISRVVNSFFRWEFNSCEMLVKGGDVYPIDYANACPDVSLTSLHYYFPWAMRTLVKWTVFCMATGQAAAHRPGHPVLLRHQRPGRSRLRAEAGGVPAAGRRLLRRRRLPGLLRQAPAGHRPPGARLGQRPRVRPAARRHRAVDLPRKRAGAVRRALPRAGRPVAERRDGPPVTRLIATRSLRRRP